MTKSILITIVSLLFLAPCILYGEPEDSSIIHRNRTLFGIDITWKNRCVWEGYIGFDEQDNFEFTEHLTSFRPGTETVIRPLPSLGITCYVSDEVYRFLDSFSRFFSFGCSSEQSVMRTLQDRLFRSYFSAVSFSVKTL